MKTRGIVSLGTLAAVVAVASIVAPMVGLRTHAAVEPARRPAPIRPVGKAQASAQKFKRAEGSVFPKEPIVVEDQLGGDSSGPLNPRAMELLGFSENAKAKKAKKARAQNKAGGVFQIQSGQPAILNARSALSAAIMTNIGGRDTQFSEVTLLADWDGREDCTADREVKVDDFSFIEPEIDLTLTRTAISEHTIANGFNENIFYYGDSDGNVFVGADTDGDGQVNLVKTFNLPTVLASTQFKLDDQVTITGLAVNPVAEFAGPGQAGEILWGSFTDSEGFQSGSSNNVNRSGLFAILLQDIPDVGFPVTVFDPFLVSVSNRSSPGGVAVDDNGDVYWHLADLVQLSGGFIVKTWDIDGDRFPDIGFSQWTGVPTTAQGGPSLLKTFGNIVSITNGPCNTVYAAVARSFVATDDPFTQLTEGLFSNPAALGPTPAMIISFADCSGDFDGCSGVATGSISTNVGGTLPIADEFADVAVAGQTLVPGVNNFRVFALGNGPDIRPGAGTSSIVTNATLKLDMLIDFSAHAGITVDENNTVFVISGGQPAGIGKNPSPMLGEILCFEDSCPQDRRADFVDLRGDDVPNPPASGGNPPPGMNVGDGDSDRFDHIFHQAPIDQITFTPTGFAGLSRGFLRYTNRLAPNLISPGVTLGNTKQTQGDDDSDGVIIFENLDPGHQVAGGDDQFSPNTGDDNDGAGTPPLGGMFEGGFEFAFGGPVGTPGCVWNGFFLNSNGNITFGTGDTSPLPNVPQFRSGLPRIAPAWADLNPNARAVTPLAQPLQAMGFSGVNSFKIRWINVPESGREDCDGIDQFGFPHNALSNTFSVTLFDDGTGVDENNSRDLSTNRRGDNSNAFDQKEGPTDLRFTTLKLTNPVGTSQLVGCSPRPEGSGIFVFDYCRMDLLGTDSRPVLVGYSIGFLNPLNNPPTPFAGLCESNLSVAAAAADAGAFGVLAGGQISAIGCSCCIGEGTEPTIFELFNEGRDAGTGSGGEVTFARPDFDLRFEGNDAALCTSTRQRDLNRGKVCFLGVGCAELQPICRSIVTGTFVTTPTTTGLVNALCAVPLNIVGCGFFPNEVTIICQGFAEDTGIPLQRPGKTVTTAASLLCDTNGDTVSDSVIVLGPVTPVNCNLITATIPISGSFGSTGSSGFPAACCGGPATIVVTTTFTPGDNNIFGLFQRISTCSLNLGTRAPVVFSVTPSNGDCSLADQDLLISGACFTFQQFGPFGTGGANTVITQQVTSVFAVDIANPANVIQARTFVVLNNNLIDAHFNFGSVNAGKTFLIFVTGPGGTSRNLTTLPAGSPTGCPIGNEQGIQVIFKCNAPGTPTNPGSPLDIATVTSCKLDRQATGQFILDVTGSKIKAGFTVTVGGLEPKKVKILEVEAGTTNPTKVRLVKKFCNGLPGNIIITNPGAAASAPFLCTERCPAN